MNKPKLVKSDKLVIDEKALEELGLAGETIYTLEYDLYAEKNLTREMKAKMSPEEIKGNERFNTLAREFRNKLAFTLKFKLYATKHLESSWLLDGEHLEIAINALEELKAEMREKGFNDCDKRIKIIPIFTTEEGFQHYEDKKAEFIFEFLMEHVRYTEEGIKEQRMSQSTLWRCKQTVAICSAHAEALKGTDRYNEVMDTISILDEQNSQCEAFLLEQKEAEKAEQEKKKK
jgi:hypothetical protein